MSKVNIGDALDNFHEAYAKAVKKENPIEFVKTLDELLTKVKTYISEVKKSNKKVAEVAEKVIQTPATELLDALTEMNKEEHARLNEQCDKIVVLIGEVEQSHREISSELKKVVKVLAPLEESLPKVIPGDKKLQVRNFLDKHKKTVTDCFENSQKLKRDADHRLLFIDVSVKEEYRKKLNEMEDVIRETMTSAQDVHERFTDIYDRTK